MSEGEAIRAGTGPAAPREIVSFRLVGQDYCVDIMNVREIRRWSAPTSLPHSPDYVRGLINLRGAVLPIIDLATRLGLPSLEATSRNVIVVASVEGQLLGLIVDGVSDIVSLRDGDIRPAPAIAAQHGQGYVQGILSIEGRMIRLLDLQRVFPTRAGEAA